MSRLLRWRPAVVGQLLVLVLVLLGAVMVVVPDGSAMADGTSWDQVGADIDGEAIYDGSGRSVAMSGDGKTVIIGATGNDGTGSLAGHARVYRLDAAGTSWVQLGADIDGEAADDYSGVSVAMSGDGNTVIIGALYNDGTGTDAGHARVYRLDAAGTSWVQLGADIDGEAADDLSGWSVAMSADGNTVIVGARYNGGTGGFAGHARVFRLDAAGTSWVQLGADIDGEAAGDESGWSVAMSADGNTVIIGAVYNDGTGTWAGHSRVFRLDAAGTSWVQLGADIDGEVTGDNSGFSVAMSADGNRVISSAARNDGTGIDAGHARVFRLDAAGTSWVQVGADIDGEAAGDFSGGSVAMSADGDTVIIGAARNDGTGIDAGHARVYRLDAAGNWVQVGADIDGEAGGDQSGYSVAMSGDGDTVIIGAPNNDGSGTDAGHARVYRLTSPPATCDGLTATLVVPAGGVNFFGTAGDDVIVGTAGVDNIYGIGGNDTICGLGGADNLNGGNGDDWISGGDGNDFVGGQGGVDTLFGDAGDDELAGGIGNDIMSGGDGEDTLRGQGNNDQMFGDGDVDTFYGGSGNDTIQTGPGGNAGTGHVVTGNGNNDTITGSTGDDVLDGQNGLDTLNGGGGNDTLTGGLGADTLNGDAGNDTLQGAGSADTLNGGADNDSLSGGAGAPDRCNGDGGTDTLADATCEITTGVP